MSNIFDTPAGLILAVGIAMAAIIFASFHFTGPDSADINKCAEIRNAEKSVACFEALD
jgi:hypothetical protein